MGSALLSPFRVSATDSPLYLNWKESEIEVKVNESSHASVGLRKSVPRKLKINALLLKKDFLISLNSFLSSSYLLQTSGD